MHEEIAMDTPSILFMIDIPFVPSLVVMVRSHGTVAKLYLCRYFIDIRATNLRKKSLLLLQYADIPHWDACMLPIPSQTIAVAIVVARCEWALNRRNLDNQTFFTHGPLLITARLVFPISWRNSYSDTALPGGLSCNPPLEVSRVTEHKRSVVQPL